MQIEFIYNFYYNGKPSWQGTLGVDVCTLRWNVYGYWEILGWPPVYGMDPRNYTNTLIPNETDWILYGSPELVFTTFNLDLGSCPFIPIVYDCTLAGNIILTACILEGNVIITDEPLPPCTRPAGLSTFNLITGYSIISPPSTIVSTISAVDACDAINYLNGLTVYDNILVNVLSTNAFSIELGAFLYVNNFTDDCTLIPNGFYFTSESLESTTIYEVIDGIIVNVINCSTTTTTTIFVDCALAGNAEEVFAPVIGCSQITSSGGPGVTDFTVGLDSIGGTIVIQLNSFGVPDKLEILHNNIKKATSGMTVPNEGPFDNLYGDPVIPSGSQATATDQFIGSSKGTIPGRFATFVSETGITDITLTMQQLIWWTYTPSDYSTASSVTVRVTGPSGTAWNIERLCSTTTTTTTTLAT